MLQSGLTVILVLSLCACGQNPAPQAEQPAKNSRQTTAEKPINQAVDKPDQKAEGHQADAEDHYAYDSTGKPDPFVPLITLEAAAKTASAPQPTTPLTPLQKYELSELRLVAIVAKAKGVTAVLEDPAGFGYIVKEGTLVGKNEGFIKKVTGDAVLVEEKIFSALGNPEPRISTLTIKHEK